MLSTHEVHRNGPYLRVVIPGVLPPDWSSLMHDVRAELDEGSLELVTVVSPHFPYDRGDREGLATLLDEIRIQGVDAFLEWRDPTLAPTLEPPWNRARRPIVEGALA